MLKLFACLFFAALIVSSSGSRAQAENQWSQGKYKISCTKNAKAKLAWFGKNGWSLFHTVHKKDSTLRVFNKGFTFTMARHYKKSGKLCVYRK